ncbi:MAG: HEPN domain protein [Candidatus Nomurabacteria bacterium GW2011_GWA2_40_9]|uniref:HEPN domain protein n=1 Tax=Candidatus Nomurabacteria bacterium GW2011_GWA2_40_9 TaxID=1618734 RepID=A0A0G0TNE5_9BACT|nr:MAG: HEPN domain protein [Candidatus Nomurabacteria bacterium GW2011_GWA2_40_9]
MSKEELTKYWFDSAEQDLLTADALMNSKRYMHSLFFCHLMLEKILKGIISRFDDTSYMTHDLLLLLEKAKIEINKDQAKFLGEVNTFNIRARYDDYKNSLYNKATEQYANDYFNRSREFKKWIEQK